MEQSFLEQLRVENYEKQMHDQRYLDDTASAFLNTGRGLGLNEGSWICDGCDNLYLGRDLKFKSLKCGNTFQEGFWICQKCKVEYGYPDQSTQYGLATYHPHWLLGLHRFNNAPGVWLLPKSPRQMRESSPLLADLDRLRWIRAEAYGKNDYRVLEIETLRERFRILRIADLSEREMVCIFYRHRLKKDTHYIPDEIFINARHLPISNSLMEFPQEYL